MLLHKWTVAALKTKCIFEYWFCGSERKLPVSFFFVLIGNSVFCVALSVPIELTDYLCQYFPFSGYYMYELYFNTALVEVQKAYSTNHVGIHAYLMQVIGLSFSEYIDILNTQKDLKPEE